MIFLHGLNLWSWGFMSGAAPATGQALNPRKVNVLKRTCSYSEKRQNLGKGRNKQKLDVDWQEPVCRNLGIGYLPPKSFARVYFGSQVLFRRSQGHQVPNRIHVLKSRKSHYFGWSIWLKMEVLAPKSKGQSATWPRQFREKPHWKVRCSTGGFFSKIGSPTPCFVLNALFLRWKPKSSHLVQPVRLMVQSKLLDPNVAVRSPPFAHFNLHCWEVDCAKNCWTPTFCWWNLHFGELSVSERGLVYTHEIAIYE